MPRSCPNCGRALEELVQEIRAMTTKNHLSSDLAVRMERELQAAIAAANQEPQDLKLMLAKLDRAKTLVDAVPSASGLLPSFADTISLVKRHLP